MQYIEQVLGVKTSILSDRVFEDLPVFIPANYEIELVEIENLQIIRIHPKGELGSFVQLKKHLSIILENENKPFFLLLDSCSAKQRDCLIKSKIPFVVDKKQLYLPFLGVFLQERYSKKKPLASKFGPIAQLIFLYYIYRHQEQVPMTLLEKSLQLSPMAVSRAVSQLESLRIIRTFKKGVSKIIASDAQGPELFEKARPYLHSPVKKRGYVDVSSLPPHALRSGLSALSEKTMLNPPLVEVYAVSSLGGDAVLEEFLSDPEKEKAIEIWAYDPALLGDGEAVDTLSLCLSLEEEKDERVLGEINDLLKKFWEDYDGKRTEDLAGTLQR